MSDGDIVQIYVSPDNREVWASVGNASPAVVRDVEAFCDNVAVSASRIRFISNPDSVWMALHLYTSAEGAVEIASVGACVADTRELNQPFTVLSRMRQCVLAPSVGGWKALDDKSAAALRVLTVDTSSLSDADVLSLLLSHPAGKALSFIQGLHVRAAIRVLRDIGEPRWFVDAMKPDSLQPVYRRMGLTPRTVKKAIDGDTGVVALRCHDVITSWMAKDVSVSAPGSFLLRRQLRESIPLKGILRASQMFASYLIRNWQQAVNSSCEGWFDPSRVFNDEETRAYLAHMSQEG